MDIVNRIVRIPIFDAGALHWWASGPSLGLWTSAQAAARR